MNGFDIRHNQLMAKITLTSVHDRPGIAAEVFSVLSERGIAVELLTTIPTGRGKGDISFAIPLDQVPEVRSQLESIRKHVGFKSIDSDPGVSVVTIHGDGLSQDPATASRVLKALAGGGVNLQMISQSLNSLSVLINRSQLPQVLGLLKGSSGTGS
jgi:aspartate kinase